jgi:hypothetical protein
MTRKQLLADFYLSLLSIPTDNVFRIINQSLYASVRDALAFDGTGGQMNALAKC